jgi:hypothetical protein
VCGGLQSGMDLGETVPYVCSETHLTVSGDGSEVSNMRVEEDHLAVALPADMAVDTVHYCVTLQC